MNVRYSSANADPPSGWIAASIGSRAVSAIITQRTSEQRGTSGTDAIEQRAVYT